MPRRTDRQLQSESDIKELILLLQLSSRWKHQAPQKLQSQITVQKAATEITDCKYINWYGGTG